jgi:hypothetical protein
MNTERNNAESIVTDQPAFQQSVRPGNSDFCSGCTIRAAFGEKHALHAIAGQTSNET